MRDTEFKEAIDNYYILTGTPPLPDAQEKAIFNSLNREGFGISKLIPAFDRMAKTGKNFRNIYGAIMWANSEISKERSERQGLETRINKLNDNDKANIALSNRYLHIIATSLRVNPGKEYMRWLESFNKKWFAICDTEPQEVSRRGKLNLLLDEIESQFDEIPEQKEYKPLDGPELEAEKLRQFKEVLELGF